ncbi:MAG: hypothetical protein KDB14_23225 [Planctomycetales bacterium]|nr:hypothetical protein [Planctomycetales bacterium]
MMMSWIRGPRTALLWEVWRLSRWELLARLGYGLLFVTLLGWFGSRGEHGMLEPAAIMAIRGTILPITMVFGVTSANWANSLSSEQQGFGFARGFVHPVSTATLVIVPFVFQVATSLACFALPALLFARITGQPTALLGPGAIVATVVTCLMAASWSATSRAGRACGIGLVVAGVVAASFAWRQTVDRDTPVLFILGQTDAFDLPATVLLTLATITGLALWLSIVAVGRQRRGESLRFTTWRAARMRHQSHHRDTPSAATTHGTELARLRGPVHAQCWLELKRAGMAVLSAAIALDILLLAGSLILSLTDGPPYGKPVIWIAGIGFGMLLFQVLGAERAIGIRMREGVADLPAYIAVLPVRNDWLILVKGMAVSLFTLAAITLLASTAAIDALTTGAGESWSQIAQQLSQPLASLHWRHGLLIACLIPCGICLTTLVCFSLTLWMPLRARLFGALWSLVLVHGFGAFAAHRAGWSLTPLWQLYSYASPMVAIALAAWFTWRAIAQRQIGAAPLAIASILWLATAIGVVSLARELVAALPAELVPPPWLFYSQITAAVIGPFSFVSLAPLGLAAHRHGLTS